MRNKEKGGRGWIVHLNSLQGKMYSNAVYFYLFWSHCGTLHARPALMSLTCAATAGTADRGKNDEVNSPTHASADREGWREKCMIVCLFVVMQSPWPCQPAHYSTQLQYTSWTGRCWEKEPGLLWMVTDGNWQMSLLFFSFCTHRPLNIHFSMSGTVFQLGKVHFLQKLNHFLLNNPNKENKKQSEYWVIKVSWGPEIPNGFEIDTVKARISSCIHLRKGARQCFKFSS